MFHGNATDDRGLRQAAVAPVRAAPMMSSSQNNRNGQFHPCVAPVTAALNVDNNVRRRHVRSQVDTLGSPLNQVDLEVSSTHFRMPGEERGSQADVSVSSALTRRSHDQSHSSSPDPRPPRDITKMLRYHFTGC